MDLFPPTAAAIEQQLRPLLQSSEEERQQLQKKLRMLFFKAIGIQILLSLTGLLIGYWMALIVRTSFIFFAILWVLTLFVFLGNRHFSYYKRQEQQERQALIERIKQLIYSTILSNWKQDIVYQANTSIANDIIQASQLFPIANKWSGKHHWTGQLKKDQTFQVAEILLQYKRMVVEKQKPPYVIHRSVFEGLLFVIEENTAPLQHALILNTHYPTKKIKTTPLKNKKDVEEILDAPLLTSPTISSEDAIGINSPLFSTFEDIPSDFQTSFLELKEELTSDFFLAFTQNKRYIAIKKDTICLEIIPQKSFLSTEVLQQLAQRLQQQLVALCHLQELSLTASSTL